MQQSSAPNSSFQDRLARLSEHKQKQVVAQGPETLMTRASMASMQAAEAAKQEQQRLRAQGQATAIPPWRENIKYPLTFVKAALLGMLGAFFGKYVVITMLSGSDDAEFSMMGYYMELGVAFAAALMVKEIFRINGEHLRKAQLVGVIFMVGMVHNFAFWMPGVIGKLYTPEWVERTTAQAVPNSFMFRGDYFVFAKEDKPKMPRRIR